MTCHMLIVVLKFFNHLHLLNNNVITLVELINFNNLVLTPKI